MSLKKVDFSSLKVRFLSSLVMGPLTMAIIIYGSYPFLALICFAAMISYKEWLGLSKKSKKAIIDSLIGLIYLAGCFSAIILLRYSFETGAWLVLSMAICVWGSDIGAYFAGKFIGGPKLAPKTSPNKTWAGFIGAAFSASGCLLAMYFIGQHVPQNMVSSQFNIEGTQDFIILVLVGLLFGMTGQIGDLFISGFKRRVEAKDTGQLIPGHGGLLDRIDALLLVAPVFLCSYIWLLNS